MFAIIMILLYNRGQFWKVIEVVHLYEKKPKIYDNKYGIEEIDSNNFFKNSPCVITILAQTYFLSNINGAMRLVSNLINPNIDNKYDLDRRIFGLGFGNVSFTGINEDSIAFTESTPNDKELNDFVDKYFLPLVSYNNSKIDKRIAMKNIRNINFLTYCDGIQIYRKIENLLLLKMQYLGFTDEEIKDILSQICLAAVSTDKTKDSTYATTIMFNDKNDSCINDKLNKEKRTDLFVLIDGFLNFVVNSDGKHGFDKYMKDDFTISNSIKVFLNKVLDNSSINNEKEEFVPVNLKSIIVDIRDEYDNNKSSEIEYDTFIFKNSSLKNDFLFNLYHSYKESNNRIDLNSLINKLELSNYNKENIDYNHRLIEIAHKGNEVIGFCLHSVDYNYQYEIRLMVCSPSYRGKNVGTELFNKTLMNIDNLGFDKCVLECSEKLDHYHFWISKGADRIRTRYIESFFSAIEIGILQISNIKERVQNLINQQDQQKILNKTLYHGQSH